MLKATRILEATRDHAREEAHTEREAGQGGHLQRSEGGG